MNEPRPRGSSDDPLLSRIRGTRKGWLRLAFFALVTAGVLFGLTRFLRVDFEATLEHLRRAEPATLALGVLATGLFPIFSAFRFRRMLGALGHDVSWARCFESIMAAWPMGTVTPSKTGDFVKAWLLRGQVAVPRVVGIVLAERLLDVLVLLALATAGMAYHGRRGFALLAGGALLAGILAVAVLATAPWRAPLKWREKLDGLLASLRQLARSPRMLAAVLLWTFLNWFASVAQLVLFYRALGNDVPLTFALGALPLAIFVGLLPVTLSGMGTRDSALIVLFAPYAAPEVTFGVGLLYALCGYWLPALIGLAFLRRMMPK